MMSVMKPQSLHPKCALILVGSMVPLTNGCVVEEIDAIIADRGVTYCPSSTGASEGTSTGSSTTADTSTGSSGTTADTSTTDDTTADATGASTDAGSSSTGPVLPVCGNGVVEADEACDDGNATPGDGCQECATDSVVFITSEVYQGFALGGLYGADQRCRSLAAKAGLQRSLTFKAWLSTATMPAADRLIHSRGRYVLVNGLVVAQNWDALTSGVLENPIMVDESSQTRDDAVWTGTLVSGQPALGSEFCKGWDDDSAVFELGGVGLSAKTDANWSFFEHGGCPSELRLYCIGQ